MVSELPSVIGPSTASFVTNRRLFLPDIDPNGSQKGEDDTNPPLITTTLYALLMSTIGSKGEVVHTMTHQGATSTY